MPIAFHQKTQQLSSFSMKDNAIFFLGKQDVLGKERNISPKWFRNQRTGTSIKRKYTDIFLPWEKIHICLFVAKTFLNQFEHRLYLEIHSCDKSPWAF